MRSARRWKPDQAGDRASSAAPRFRPRSTCWNLVGKVDALVIGGGMANTFLHAQGVAVGKSLCKHPTALRIHGKAARQLAPSSLPVDAVVALDFAANAPSHAYGLDAIPPTA